MSYARKKRNYKKKSWRNSSKKTWKNTKRNLAIHLRTRIKQSKKSRHSSLNSKVSKKKWNNG